LSLAHPLRDQTEILFSDSPEDLISEMTKLLDHIHKDYTKLYY